MVQGRLTFSQYFGHIKTRDFGMKKSMFTNELIAFALRQTETGTRVAEVCRKMGISDATFYNWMKKYDDLAR
jgi:transposase-like protein